MPEDTPSELIITGPPRDIPQDIIQFDDGGRERVLIRDGATYREISDTPPEHHHVYRPIRWTSPSLHDFARLVHKYAHVKTALIFHTDKAILCCMDHTDRRETITHPIKHSLEWTHLAATDQDIKQKALVNILESFPHVLGDNTLLLATLTSITMKKDVAITSDIDRDRINLSYTSTAGAQVVALPRQIMLRMPVFEGGDIITVPVKLDIENDIPSGKDGITFSLSVPTRPRLVIEALALYKQRLTELLPDPWMVVEGETN